MDALCPRPLKGYPKLRKVASQSVTGFGETGRSAVYSNSSSFGSYASTKSLPEAVVTLPDVVMISVLEISKK